jgi:hypothetical protein
VFAYLGNFTMQEMADLAFGVQEKWKTEEIDRYGLVEDFLDGLLSDDSRHDQALATDAELLSRINVITTVRRGWAGLATSIRQPEDLEHLRELLLQTTWM